MKIILLLFAFLFSFLYVPSFAEEDDDGLGAVEVSTSVLSSFDLKKEVIKAYDSGISEMYKLEFEKAEKEFEQLIKISPKTPEGYLAKAALIWWKFSQNFDSQGKKNISMEKAFFKNTDTAIKLSQQMLKSGADKDQAYFFMGTAYGLEGRWHAVKQSWWKAYKAGKKGRKFLKKSLQENSAIYDAYLGLGIFDYYTATLPGVIGFGAKLFIGGDRDRGIEYVKIAAEKGHYYKMEAQLFLIEIYSVHEKNFEEAYRYIRALRDADRQNMLFMLGEVMVLLYEQDWEGVLASTRELIYAIDENPNTPMKYQIGSVYLSRANALIALKRFDEAENLLKKSLSPSEYSDKGWITYCMLRLAQVYDLRGYRAEALQLYQQVKERQNFWDSTKYAKRGLKKVTDYDELMRQIQE